MWAKGQHSKNTDRDKVWMSIRILRRFSLPDVLRTSGAKYHNAKNFLRCLVIHGYVAKDGKWLPGKPGLYKVYRLVKESPERPVVCETCGKLISKRKCERPEEKNER